MDMLVHSCLREALKRSPVRYRLSFGCFWALCPRVSISALPLSFASSRSATEAFHIISSCSLGVPNEAGGPVGELFRSGVSICVLSWGGRTWFFCVFYFYCHPRRPPPPPPPPPPPTVRAVRVAGRLDLALLWSFPSWTLHTQSVVLFVGVPDIKPYF